MSEDANTGRSPSSSTAADAGAKRPLPLTDDDQDDRVIITRGEDFRLYHRSFWEILAESAWALFVVLGFLAMAVVGIVITLLS